jgi:predicted nuclease of predicted toxin-antitoxin system
MKLLFDNNLSHKLVSNLRDLFPGSVHVMNKKLDESNDQEVWEFAKANGYTIITKDSDFNDLSILKGAPPKVIWIRCGNCNVSRIEDTIRKNFKILQSFIKDQSVNIIKID